MGESIHHAEEKSKFHRKSPTSPVIAVTARHRNAKRQNLYRKGRNGRTEKTQNLLPRMNAKHTNCQMQKTCYGDAEKTAKHLPQMNADFEEEIGREIRAETHELQKPTTKNGGTEKTGAHRIK